MPALVETMFSVRQPPWHGVGTVVQEAPTSAEALHRAGLAWRVRQDPVYVHGMPVPPYVANVREDTGAVLGIVTDRYRPVQNEAAFAWTDLLLNSRDVRYETAGSLREGRTVWLLARLRDQRSILGDEVAPYLLFANNHDGRGAVRVVMTPIRVVCWNTLNLALHRVGHSADRSWSVAHLGNLEGHLLEAQQTLGLATRYLDGLQQAAEHLASRKIGNRWLEIVAKLIPTPDNAADRQRARVAQLREDLLQRMEAPDLRRFRGTGWGVINAVADHAAHRPLSAAPTPVAAERRFGQLAFGHPLRERALRLVLAA